jgi:hypothetical protein
MKGRKKSYQPQLVIPTQVQKLPIYLCPSPLQDGKKNCQPELSNERYQELMSDALLAISG